MDKSETLAEAKERLKNLTMDELLEEISVHSPGQWENEVSKNLKDWYAVSNDIGIIAYFGDEKLAFGFRLDYINSILND